MCPHSILTGNATSSAKAHTNDTFSLTCIDPIPLSVACLPCDWSMHLEFLQLIQRMRCARACTSASPT